MQHILEELEKRRAQARAGGGPKRIASQHAKGKLTARERLDLLLDEGSFEEFDMFVEHRSHDFGMAEAALPGRRGGHRLGNRSTAASSTSSPRISRSSADLFRRRTPRRSSRCRRWRLRNGAPIIGLFDAGGARIQEGVDSLAGYADIFLQNVLSSRRHPADQRDHGPLRRRRRLFAGDDRLHLHGEGHRLHVRHRPGRGEDGHQRGRQPRGTRRLPRPRAEVAASPTAPSTTTWRP